MEGMGGSLSGRLNLQPYANMTGGNVEPPVASRGYTRPMVAIAFKVALAVACALLGAWALRTRLVDLPERHFLLGALGLQLLPALGAFVALYGVGHQEPTSDVPGFYMPAARAVLAGQLPYRDFVLSYAPLFAYVGAALVAVWNSGKAFALFAILLNAAALVWWHRAAQACFDRSTVRHCTILYATSGHVLSQALLGTNQAWVGAGLAASAMLMTGDRSASSGLAQAFTASVTKILAHLFWPVLWICAPRRFHWLAAAALPTAAVYGIFVVAGAGTAVLPLRAEGEAISPGNLPYLLDLVLSAAGSYERLLYDGLALTMLGLTTVWLYLNARSLPPQSRQNLLLAGLAITGLVFMLFSKKSFTGYVIFVLYPVILMLVCGVVGRRARVAFLLVFNVLLVAEPSVWFYLKGNGRSLRTWLQTGNSVAILGFVALDCALLACYVYLAWLSVRGVRTMAAGAIRSKNSSQSATACALV